MMSTVLETPELVCSLVVFYGKTTGGFLIALHKLIGNILLSGEIISYVKNE